MKAEDRKRTPHPGPLPVWRGEGEAAAGRAAARPYRGRAFTLIELLTVIAIIAVVAAFLIPVMKGVKRSQYLSNARTELAELDTAIQNYKTDHGYYPPGGTSVLTNALYYELIGTTTADGGNTFKTLDGMSTISSATLGSTFGESGLLNSGVTNRGAGAEDARVARSFLPDLRQGQLATNNNGAMILVYSFGGPDSTNRFFQLLPGFTALPGGGANPWRYNASNPTNNPGSYDLWVQLCIGGTTNLVCNWSKQVQLNNPLP